LKSDFPSEWLHVTERRVLIVEDDQTLRDIIAEALREDDYAVLTAENGATALALIERWSPDLVILDLMMPRMNGEQFCSELRQLDGMATVPLIVVSASRFAADIAARVSAHAALTKPFDLLELTGHVRTLLP
jgi:DNA-binding response OmpR family regulator